MNTQTNQSNITPPRLVPALLNGFNTVANHIGLILFPVILDVFLWFGPHFRIYDLMQPVIQQMSEMPGMDTPDMVKLLDTTNQLWQSFLSQFNLAVVLRTFPIGVSSLLSGTSPVNTPLGTAPVIEITSGITAIGWWLLFILIGIVAGALFFSLTAQYTLKNDQSLTVRRLGQNILQVFLLTFAGILLIIVLTLPMMIILSLIALVNISLAQLILLIYSLFLIWTMVPLLFSPHGIFVNRQNALISMLTSVRLVRFVLSSSGLFFLSVLVLSQGLDVLWKIPPASSWLSFVGIAGHGFVTTGLLAASFYYYQDALHYVQDFLQRSVVSMPDPSSQFKL